MKNVETFYPLSPMQEGMLFDTVYATGAGVYVAQISGRLLGEIDLPVFTRAWQHVVDRHQILRTFILWEGVQRPVQVVRHEAALVPELLDWRDVLAAEHDARLQEFLAADRARGFVLTQAPLMRVTCIRLAEDAYQFVWTFHHMVLDGWSVFLVLGEVAACYEALLRGQTPQLKPTRPYRDYIVWLQQQDAAAAEAFWRAQVGGISEPTTLGTPKQGTSGGAAARRKTAEQQVSLPAATTAALQTLARTHRLTLNSIVQGAWALLLSHYTKREQVVFGTTVSGRPPELPGIETVVGLFINAIPVRASVAPGARLLPWLADLQARHVEARRYEYTPLVQIQGWSEVPRGVMMFESVLGFHNFPKQVQLGAQGAARPRVAMDQFRSESQISLPLSVNVTPGAELLLNMRYDSDYFAEADITRILDGFAELLGAIPAHSQATLGELLSLLAAVAERQQAAAAEKYEDALRQKLKGLKRTPRAKSLQQANG